MKKRIEETDRLLAALEVRGDSVMLLAEARKKLGQAYIEAEKEERDEK